MKKTISINISGQIFNVEEQGYDNLKSYLAAITQYFSTYGESKEILSDIEARIAEKFWDKQKKNNTKAITNADIEELISSMGTVADFEAMKEEEDMDVKPVIATNNVVNESKEVQPNGEVPKAKPESRSTNQTKVLYRDSKNKLIGGVCAGIGHYFSLDPVWIRLFFLAMLGLVPIAEPLAQLSGFVFLLYIACWIAFPANNNLAEDKEVKKLFRDPDKKMLGGVAAGLAKYTEIEIGLIRLIFVISILFFGTGLMLYLILWAITPFAKTITDKMQMKGQPITLTNIESNIIKEQNRSAVAESAISKILYFPFRAIKAIFGASGPLVQFLLAGIRVFFGLLLSFIGIVAIFALAASLLSAFGVFGDLPIGVIDGIPIHAIGIDAPRSMFVFLFFALVIPFLVMAFAGFSIISKKNLFNSVMVQTLGGLWLMGILGSGISVSKYATNFSKLGIFEKTLSYKSTAATPVFDIKYYDDYQGFNDVNFRFGESKTSDIEILETLKARGATKELGEKNAQMINYEITQKDSLFLFNENFEVKPKQIFRNQKLNLKIMVPKGKPFIITRNMANNSKLDLDWETIDWSKGINKINDDEAARFIINKDGNVECLDLYLNKEETTNPNGEFSKEIILQGFINMEISNNFKVEFIKSEINKVTILTTDNNYLEKVKVDQNGDKVIIRSDNSSIYEGNQVKLKIEYSNLSELKLNDDVEAAIQNYNGSSQSVKIFMKNHSKLSISGEVDNLEIETRDNSNFEGDELSINNAKISSFNQSTANIKVINELNAKSFDEAAIEYSGIPKEVSLSPKNSSKITKSDNN